MKTLKKHIDFENAYAVDFERDEDDVIIRLHQGDRHLDPVSGSSSQVYLKSYFKKYGFDENLLFLELKAFIGILWHDMEEIQRRFVF